MNSKVIFCCLSLVLAAHAGPLDDFAKLETEMEVAEEAFGRAIEAMTKAALASKVPADSTGGPPIPPKPPVDGRVPVLKKMDELATASAGSPDASALAFGAFRWAIGIEPARCAERFYKLVQRFPDDEALGEFFPVIADLASEGESPENWIKALEELRKTSKKKDNVFGAQYALGRAYFQAGKLTEARAAFGQARESADPYLAKAAKGFLWEMDHLQAGMPAPEFVAKTLDGKEVSLKSLRGKVVLLNFWATWCPPCVGEIPHLQAAVSQLSGKPFEILAISVDAEREALVGFLKVRSMPGLVTWHEKGEDNPIAELYNVLQLPSWFLIDTNGVIRQRNPDSAQLVEIVQAMLEPAKTP